MTLAIFRVKPAAPGRQSVKVTKEKSAENRAALIKTAARMFRERGIDGVGVGEISKAAGLTHGALYAQVPVEAGFGCGGLRAWVRGQPRLHDGTQAPWRADIVRPSVSLHVP